MFFFHMYDAHLFFTISKITIEQPIGVKANLLRSFTSIQGQLEETCFSGEKQVQWKNLVFGLCLFNAVLHERKKYSQLGWNVPYEFNDSDFEANFQNNLFLIAWIIA